MQLKLVLPLALVLQLAPPLLITTWLRKPKNQRKQPRILQVQQLAQQLCQGSFNIKGKSTFKEEFVTAGGIDLKEIDFKTMRSKVLPNIYFAGEVLNIDAVTGGFNFQNAWTTGFIAAKAIASLTH